MHVLCDTNADVAHTLGPRMMREAAALNFPAGPRPSLASVLIGRCRREWPRNVARRRAPLRRDSAAPRVASFESSWRSCSGASRDAMLGSRVHGPANFVVEPGIAAVKAPPAAADLLVRKHRAPQERSSRFGGRRRTIPSRRCSGPDDAERSRPHRMQTRRRAMRNRALGPLFTKREQSGSSVLRGAMRAAGGESERKLRARPRALRCTTWRAVGHAAPRQLAACCARGIALLVTCACHMNPPCELRGACFFSRARGGGLAQRGRARAEFEQPRDDPHALSSHRDATSRGSGSRGEQPRVAPRDGGLESTSAGTETPARRLRDDDAKRSARRLPRSQRAHFR